MEERWRRDGGWRMERGERREKVGIEAGEGGGEDGRWRKEMEEKEMKKERGEQYHYVGRT